MADVSAVDREAARFLASVGRISDAELGAVVEGEAFGGNGFGADSAGVQMFRPRYDFDGSRLER